MTGASSGQTIGFALSPSCSLITETSGTITIGTNLTMAGPGAGTLAVSGELSPLTASTVFVVEDGVTATISGLTIENGGRNASVCDGGGIFNSGTLTVTDSSLSDNSAAQCAGGGVYNNGGALVVTDSTLSHNSAGNTGGGGIYNDGGTVNVAGSTLSRQQQRRRRQRDLQRVRHGHRQRQHHVRQHRRRGRRRDQQRVRLGHSHRQHPVRKQRRQRRRDRQRVRHGQRQQQHPVGKQRRLRRRRRNLQRRHDQRQRQHALRQQRRRRRRDLQRELCGATVNVLDSTVSGNSGAAGGGGIYNYGVGTVNVTDSTLSGNSVASVGGGGILNVGTLTVIHATLSDNTAPAGTGSGLWNFGTTTLAATIVANSGAGLDCFGEGTLTGGYSLDDDGSCALSGTSLSDTQPGLDPAGLQNNGGPTQTIALEPDSAAVDHVTLAADCTLNDQRGVPWPTPCDIGAIGETTTTSLSGGGQSGTSITVVAGTAVTDTATLLGTNPSTATGTVTYGVYSDSGCTTAVSTGTAETIITPGALPASSPVTLSTPGTYYWQASYSGDSANASSASPCGATGEVETVTAAPPVVPGPPRDATAVAGNGQVTVSWTAPQSDGNSPITAYTVTASSGSRTCSTAGALSCVVSGLGQRDRLHLYCHRDQHEGNRAALGAIGMGHPGTICGGPRDSAEFAGAATAISEGGDGAVWVVGTPTVAGGHPLYRWNGAGWTLEPGGATAIAVGPNGSPGLLTRRTRSSSGPAPRGSSSRGRPRPSAKAVTGRCGSSVPPPWPAATPCSGGMGPAGPSNPVGPPPSRSDPTVSPGLLTRRTRSSSGPAPRGSSSRGRPRPSAKAVTGRCGSSVPPPWPAATPCSGGMGPAGPSNPVGPPPSRLDPTACPGSPTAPTRSIKADPGPDIEADSPSVERAAGRADLA